MATMRCCCDEVNEHGASCMIPQEVADAFANGIHDVIVRFRSSSGSPSVQNQTAATLDEHRERIILLVSYNDDNAWRTNVKNRRQVADHHRLGHEHGIEDEHRVWVETRREWTPQAERNGMRLPRFQLSKSDSERRGAMKVPSRFMLAVTLVTKRKSSVKCFFDEWPEIIRRIAEPTWVIDVR
ncbi:hypothetical protein C8R44DRAFT_737160 [Mycena epipterygia]|nr:hypothetical protein C8R44DRAFT_737160 [Mycena epipterygia]